MIDFSNLSYSDFEQVVVRIPALDTTELRLQLAPSNVTASTLFHTAAFFRVAGKYFHEIGPTQYKLSLTYLVGPRGILNYLGDQGIHHEARESAITAQYDLFKQVFSINSLGSMCFMWFEFLYANGGPNATAVINDSEMLDPLLQLLGNILLLPGLQCKEAALHGLMHLRSTKAKTLAFKTIEGYISRSDPKNAEEASVCKYAKECLLGAI